MPYTPEQHRRRVKRYRLERSRGVQHRVATTAIRAHVDELLAAGMTKTAIALAAGYSESATLSGYLRRDVIHRNTQARILAVTAASVAQAGAPHRILATGPRRRLQALAAIGWDLPTLALHTPVRFASLRAIRDGLYPHVLSTIAADVVDLYERLAMTPGPSGPARRAARRHAWAPPLAWDDDSIDDPAATPDLGTDRHVLPRELLLEEFAHTHDEHGGSVSRAAARLGMQPTSLARALARARAAGHDVRYVDDVHERGAA